MEDLSKARESLVGAETSRVHLQERVEELSRHLQGNEEKLSVYERRSSTVGGVHQSADRDASREHQFEAEVAELRCVFASHQSNDLALTPCHSKICPESCRSRPFNCTEPRATVPGDQPG